MEVCARKGQKDEDMRGRQDRTVCGCSEKKLSDQEQQNKPNLLITTWATSDLGFVYGCTCALRVGPECAQKRKRMV